MFEPFSQINTNLFACLYTVNTRMLTHGSPYEFLFRPASGPMGKLLPRKIRIKKGANVGSMVFLRGAPGTATYQLG